jgi:hypothetical protein
MFDSNNLAPYIYVSIEDIYTKVAAHYFKLNNNKKARDYVTRGLKYYPQSYRLQNSLKMLN